MPEIKPEAKSVKPFVACSCGSKEFHCFEEYVHTGEVDDDGEIVFKCDGSEIKKIVCANCGKKHSDDKFKEISFD